MAWPPTLEDFTSDLDEPVGGFKVADEERLQTILDAAVAFVERVRSEFNYDNDPFSGYPEPPDDLVLGTIRLAGRWWSRRRSADALVEMGTMGATRIPSFDPDIERLLGIGRFRGAVFA